MVRLPHRRSADKLPTVSRYCLLSVSINQLDKADAPLIPTYISFRAMPRLTTSRGIPSSLQHHRGPKPPAGLNEPEHALGPLDRTMLPETEPAREGLQTVRAMLNAGRPVLLVALCLLLTTNLSDSLFGDALGALQTLARAAGCHQECVDILQELRVE
jgi:hypothetical protein